MLYEIVENFKSKLFFLLHKNDTFVPAGTEPISASAFSSNSSSAFSFKDLDFKNFNFKEIDFNTKRLIVLGIVALISLVAMLKISSNYSSFTTARNNYRLSQDNKKDVDGWTEFIENRKKILSTKKTTTDITTDLNNSVIKEPML